MGESVVINSKNALKTLILRAKDSYWTGQFHAMIWFHEKRLFVLLKPTEANFHNIIALNHTSETVCLICKLFSSVIVRSSIYRT